MSLTIETGIPVPVGRFRDDGVLGELRVVLRKMKKKQSVVVPGTRCDINTRIYRAAKEAGVKITARKLNGEGYRVWRIA